MLSNALLFLSNTILGLLTLAFLLRFFFQVTGVSFQNPAAELILTVTNFAVMPMRKLMAKFKHFGIRKYDVSTVLLAFISQVLLKIINLSFSSFAPSGMQSALSANLLLAALISIIAISLSIFMYAVLIQAVLSWVNPHTAIAPVLNNLTQPVLKRIRKIVPMAGNIDLSPLVFIIFAQLVLTTFLLPFEHALLIGQ